MLHGRARERTQIQALLDGAVAGTGGALVISGEAGIGKSTLVDFAADRAGALLVLRATGTPAETDLGHATLQRLLMPVQHRIADLPGPQAAALGIAFGEREGPPPDRFLIAMATLTLLSEAAGDRAVLCLVDDAHWADGPSLDTLTFVARRLEREPVALVFATRGGSGGSGSGGVSERSFDGLSALPLAGLDPDSAQTLLDQRPGAALSGSDRAAVLRLAAGNPLALLELPLDAVPAMLAGEPVPIGVELTTAFRAAVDGLDRPARQALLLVAAAGAAPAGVLDAAAAHCSTDGRPTADGLWGNTPLLIQGPTDVTFRHPLIASAVYSSADPADRRSAHAALAAAWSDLDPERSVWHLGKATESPDESVAAQLERSAERTLRRAGAAAAAGTLRRAAALTPSDPTRAVRLLAAARAAVLAGNLPHAEQLIDDAERLGVPGSARYQLAIARASIALRAGDPADAAALLQPLAVDALEADEDVAVAIHLLYGEATFQANLAPDGALPPALERASIALRADSEAGRLLQLLRGVHRVRAGRPAEVSDADLAATYTLTDPYRLCWAGGMLWGIGDLPAARRLRARAVRQARSQGAAGALAWALEYTVVDDVLRCRLDQAEEAADEGYRLAVDTGQPNTACRLRSWLALIGALRDGTANSERSAEQALAEAESRRLSGAAATAMRALALPLLAAGRPADALRKLAGLGRGVGTHPGIALYNVPDAIEAAARSQQIPHAAALLEDYLAWTAATGAPDLLALAARCRALLAEGETADKFFAEALRRHHDGDQPFELARTQLLYGEHLRRTRRPSLAREELTAALEVFHRHNLPGWVDRARGELRAAGGNQPAAGGGQPTGLPAALGELTAQERRIVTAVATGATNREIAAGLFVSPRTVDYHLRKVFTKLGVSSRTELAALNSATSDDAGYSPPPR